MTRRGSGSITIFLSLTLMLLISFLCAGLHSAQAAGRRYLFTVATEAAAQSVFGAYDTRVWEQYRVLMMTDQRLAAQIGEECARAYEKNGTLFSLEDLSVELGDAVTVAENGAAGWEEAIVSYMEVRLPVNLVAQWVEQLDLIKELDDMTRWMKGFRDLIQPLFQLEKNLCKLEKRLSEAVKTYERGKGLLRELQTCCEAIGKIVAMAPDEENDGDSSASDTVVFDEAAFDEAWSALEISYQKIQEYLQDSGWQLDAITREAEEGLSAATELQSMVTRLINTLSGDDSGLSSLADLGGYLSGLTERFGFLQKLPKELAEQKEYLRRVSEITLPSAQEVRTAAGQEILDFLQGLVEGFVTEVWEPDVPVTEEGAEEEEDRVGILMQLRSWLDQGVLGLVLEDASQVSSASLGRSLERSQRQGTGELLQEAYRRVMCVEYALRYTADGGKDRAEGIRDRSSGEADRSAGAGLQYETEYVIAGHTKDVANLAAVAERLLLARGALNLMYLLQNNSTQEALRVAAAGLSATLGGWIPVGLMTVLLMVVWAMAEAVCDVRALLSGRQVPFWKDADSWKLALEHLWTLLDDGFVTGLDRADGMSYQEYLRLLLYPIPTEEICYRLMEVAEENLRAQRKTFCIDQGWCQAEVVLTGMVAGKSMEQKITYGY